MSRCTCAACEKRNREYAPPFTMNRGTLGRNGDLAPRHIVDDTKRMILARRHKAYGSVQITEEQAEELARNLVQMWQLRERG